MQVDCICESEACDICKNKKGGQSKLSLYQCPNSMIDDEFSRLIPYFYVWLNSEFTVYPDGRGRYYQPVKLLQAFELLLKVKQTNEKKKVKDE